MQAYLQDDGRDQRGPTRAYVTLVSVKYGKDDELVETTERAGIWAWKHPPTTTPPPAYKLAGDITFTDVDFGYLPERTVLHGISLYGRPGQKIAFVGSTVPAEPPSPT